MNAKAPTLVGKAKPPSAGGKFPARLHVLLAREAKVGLVIRRGPSQSVCAVLWDRERDTFQLGQWLRGRIYERRGDLSPDGRHFIYFALNGRWKSETKGSHTAISRAPYLKAVSLFAKGDGWHGGGLFLSNQDFWLNDGGGHQELKSDKGLRRKIDGHPPDYFGGECPNVYYNRLRRDGWAMAGDECQGATLFEKCLPNSWRLRRFAFAEVGPPPGRGGQWDTHELRHGDTGSMLTFPEWEWADFVDGRLVWATEGKLCAAKLGPGTLLGINVLRDFNEMKFEALAAPY